MRRRHSVEGFGMVANDAELRYMPDGKPVISLNVASGMYNDVTVWFRVSAFGKFAEAIAPYMKAKANIWFRGTLSPDKETGNPRIWGDDTPRASYEVVASDINILEFAPQAEQGDKQATPQEAPVESVDEDDIPF